MIALLWLNLRLRWTEWRDEIEFVTMRKRASWYIPKGPK